MRYIVCLLVCMILQSCKNDEEEFHSLQFDVSGIDLSYNKQSGTFDGTISAEDCEFTLVGKGEFSEYVYVSSIEINGIPQKVEGIDGGFIRPQRGVPLILKGEWGELKYLTDSAPYMIELRISANKENEPRNIEIQLGHGYWISRINLNQQNAKIGWDNIVCNQVSSNDLFIGSQYLGIQNWDCIGDPPQIYPSAVFPDKTFAKSFDKEVNETKRPITLYTDFSNPFISTIKQPSGVTYQHFVKDLIKSEEYESNNQPHLHLYRLANIISVENLSKIFPDNGKLVKTLEDIVKQKVNVKQFQNWIVGEVVFKGFSVTMDAPGQKGLFENSNIQTKGLVYIRSMTYGATAYFIMGSNLPYDEVKTLLSTPSIVDNAKEKLSESAIILISNSSVDQNATLSTSFEALNTFIESPYTKGSYGYPIYCTGCYLDDNRYFHFNELLD